MFQQRTFQLAISIEDLGTSCKLDGNINNYTEVKLASFLQR